MGLLAPLTPKVMGAATCPASDQTSATGSGDTVAKHASMMGYNMTGMKRECANTNASRVHAKFGKVLSRRPEFMDFVLSRPGNAVIDQGLFMQRGGFGGQASRVAPGHPPHARRGVSTIFVAVLVLVLVGLAGLATDMAYALFVGHQLQVVADAAALSGARALPDGPARARAVAIEVAANNAVAGAPLRLSANLDNAPDGDIALGWYDLDTRNFIADEERTNAVRVVARRTRSSDSGALPLVFGPMFGIETVDLTRVAVATVARGALPRLIVLQPDGVCAFQMIGFGRIDLRGDVDAMGNFAAIQVNSINARAVCHTGRTEVEADELNVVGEVLRGGRLNIDGVIQAGAPPLEDPLIDLPAPEWNGSNIHDAIIETNGRTIRLTPGHYPDGIVIDDGRLELEPGIYVLGGAGLVVRGNSSLVAEGVMLYLVAPGGLELDSAGELRITPLRGDQLPSGEDDFTRPPASAYEGLSVFQARGNDQRSMRISGARQLELTGIVYLPDAHLEIRDTTGQIGTQVITSTMRMVHSNISIVGPALRGPSGRAPFLIE